MVIKSSRRRHCTNNHTSPQSHSSALAGALRDLEHVFSQADARKEERFRRGGILPSDALTFIEHGPLRVLLSATPTSATLPSYVDALRSYGVSHVVRVCEPLHYHPESLTAQGFVHHDWPFADGEAPHDVVVRNWLGLLDDLFQLRRHAAKFPSWGFFHQKDNNMNNNEFSDVASLSLSSSVASLSTSTSPNSSADGISPKHHHQYGSSNSSVSTPSSPQQRGKASPTAAPPATSKPTTVAIHCAAGLGRAPVLVALALVELGLSPHEAVGWMRAERRGAINAKQLAYLQQYQRRSSHLQHAAHHQFDQCQQQLMDYEHHHRARRDGNGGVCGPAKKKGRSASNNSAGQNNNHNNNSLGRCRKESGGVESIAGGGGCTSSASTADNNNSSKALRSRSPFSFLASWRRSLSPSGKAKQQQHEQQTVESPRVSDCGSCTGSVNGGSGKHARKSSGSGLLGGIWSGSSGVSSRCASPNASGATTTSSIATTTTNTSSNSFGAHSQQQQQYYSKPRSATTGSAPPYTQSSTGAGAAAQQQQQQTTVQYNFYQPSQVFVVQQQHHHHHHHHHNNNNSVYQYQYFHAGQQQQRHGNGGGPTAQREQEQGVGTVSEMMLKKAGFYHYHNESRSQSPSRHYHVQPQQQEEQEDVEDSPSSSYQTLKAMRKAQLAQGRYVSM